jgi:hypothetical protein
MHGSKAFNDAFRRAIRREPEPKANSTEPAPPPRHQSIDAGAGTSGARLRPPPSMNDLIRGAERETKPW